MKRWHTIITILLSTLMLISMSACRELTDEEIGMRNKARWDRLPESRKHEHRRRDLFASLFFLEWEDRTSDLLYQVQWSGKRNIEFVMSQEDAKAGKKNTLYAWPSMFTDRILYTFNFFFREDDIDLSTFYVAYPVTMEDLLEHWEEILALYFRLNTGMLSLNFPNGYVPIMFAKAEEAGDPMIAQVQFAHYWWFSTNSKHGEGELVTNSLRGRYVYHLESPDGVFTDIVFVHSEEDAIGFEDDILVAWPDPLAMHLLQRNLDTLNRSIRERNIDLSIYSLRYPITVIDLVDNWEQVHTVWIEVNSP
jgi:hypothetical protein